MPSVVVEGPVAAVRFGVPVSDLEALARRIHVLRLHLVEFERCPDWECVQNQERLARVQA